MKKLLFLTLLIFSLKPIECSWYELFKEKAQSSFLYFSNNKAVASTIGLTGLSAYLAHKAYCQKQTILKLEIENRRIKQEGETFSAYIMASLKPLLPEGSKFERYNNELKFRVTTTMDQTKHEESLETFIKRQTEMNKQMYSTLQELSESNTGIRIHTPLNSVLDCYQNVSFKHGIYVTCQTGDSILVPYW